MNLYIYSSILIIAAMASLGTAYMSWKKRPAIGSVSISILMICISEWIICQLLYMLTKNHGIRLFWNELKFLGVVTLPVTLLALVAEYTNRKKLIKKKIILFLLIIPIITLIMILTNKYHGLFRYNIEFINIRGREILVSEYGVWFWVHTAYSYILLFKSLLFLILQYIYLPRAYKGQARIIIIGALIPWIYNIIYFVFLNEKNIIDITPLSFSLTGIIAFWGVFRYKLLDLSPIAKDLVFESIEDIAIVLDTRMRVVDINLAARNTFEQEDNQIIGKLIYEILPEWSYISNGEGEINGNDKKLVLTRSQQERHFEVRNTIVCDQENRKVGYLILLHDITELERIMSEIEASRIKAEEANRLKSIFLANMSHEIRTPMNGVLGMIDIMESSKLEEEQRENLGIIKDSAESLLLIINDILDYSKIESGKMNLEKIEFDVKKLIEHSVKMFTAKASEKKIELVCDIEKEVPEVLIGDSLRIRQIMNNLISNAIKFTLKGTIVVKIKTVRYFNDEVLLRFIVEDSGIGIPSEKRDTLFNSFEQVDSSTTRKYGGTGLGLAIVKKLVELMKGSIEVESAINNGSTFTVEIPFKVQKKAEVIKEIEETLEPNIIDRRKTTILLAEDNQVNQLIMKKMLQKNGLNVEIAQNGKVVLEKLENEAFDIIFMDVQMPILDGYETTSIIRARNIDIPIIALTANAMEGDREKCLNSGMNDYLSKPVMSRKLLEMIDKYV
ncbi:histidine kinase N-terminal 7TM domain-containing protein [Wukongibacter baidiensis]|uniref:histidine kinase N-terminal 7TM domain-containing protein n=1 Tax=Wukongibacter baidiensis TaxID=1723361 RepID=UPI003D8001DC